MKRISLLTTVCLVLMCNTAPAPIYGGFESLNKLIDRAEFVVVAEIAKRPALEEFDIGGGATFEIEVAKVIKGDVKAGKRITQVVWLDHNAEEAAKFYLSIFKGSSKDPNIDRYTEAGVDSKARFTGVRLWIEGQDIVLLNGGPKLKPTEATALTLNCDLQEEIDYYWEKLSAGGEKGRGGWVKDKFGVWWHVVPTDLPLLLGGKYRSSERVMNAMLTMDKIDSAALRRAADMTAASPKTK